jgi:hypothetical protein
MKELMYRVLRTYKSRIKYIPQTQEWQLISYNLAARGLIMEHGEGFKITREGRTQLELEKALRAIAR